MDSALPIEVVLARDPTVKVGSERGIADFNSGRITPWGKVKDQPPWLAHFTSNAPLKGNWSVYFDHGGLCAILKKAAYWKGRDYCKTEYWLVRKGESFGDRVKSVRIWQGRLNNNVLVPMLHTLGHADHIAERAGT